jgi:hypothetical protein
MLDRVVFSCQQNGVNIFYKCIEFQVDSFELLRNFNYTDKRRQLHPAFYLSYSPFLTWNFFKKYNFSIIMIDIEMKLNIPVHYQMGNPLQQGRWPCEEIPSQKGGITQIKCWMELSSLVNRLRSTLSTSVLSFKLIALIVIEKF